MGTDPMFRILPLLILLLVGCASAPEEPPLDPITHKLADASERIALAYERLALVASAAKADDYLSQSYNYSEHDVPAMWLEEITLVEDFNGDLVTFMDVLASVGGMKPPRIDDSTTRRPVIVSIRAGKRKLISFLADAGYQAADDAVVRAVADLNQVLIEYKKP